MTWRRLKWKLREFFLGRPPTKYDEFRDRVRVSMIYFVHYPGLITGPPHFVVSNFWEGLEDLKGKVCLQCYKITDPNLIKLQRNSCGDADRTFVCDCPPHN